MPTPLRNLVASARTACTRAALEGAMWLASALPLPVAYRLGRAGGYLVCVAWPRGRRASEAALSRVSGGDRALARRRARASFAYYGTYLVDFLRFGRITPAEVAAAIDFNDWGPIEALRAGNGAVFVTLHFGNWDLAGAILAQRWPLTAIADAFDNPALDHVVMASRRRLGMHVVPAGRTGPEVLRALRRNHVLAALADVPPAGGGVRVRFFGAPLDVPDGLARIALREGTPIIVGGAWRKGPTDARFDASAEPVAFAPSGDRERDVRELSQAMVEALERLVLRAPEQWYVFRDLWRSARAPEAAASGVLREEAPFTADVR